MLCLHWFFRFLMIVIDYWLNLEIIIGCQGGENTVAFLLKFCEAGQFLYLLLANLES
jgi:hypothetical protein